MRHHPVHVANQWLHAYHISDKHPLLMKTEHLLHNSRTWLAILFLTVLTAIFALLLFSEGPVARFDIYNPLGPMIY